jgi:dihydroneopterin aldolase
MVLTEGEKRDGALNDLVEICFEDERVEKVKLRVEKPGAVRFSASVGVEIERQRGA